MNYLIWNGKDSRDIKGLIISELPPISKPQMRAVETVIDGVDGSIIEEVGYSSYDKALIIGITPNADIDQISQYFSGSGDVVFGNEADKVYKANIINQIDYARLVRFRTATVVFRVQPFKYEYLEKEASIATESEEGTSITLTKDNKKLVEVGVYGNSTQDGTPTPSVPVEIENIGKYNEETGKYDLEINVNTKRATISLDEPLRSIPNGAKDIAYIKGNKVFVERYTDYTILNGNEDWTMSTLPNGNAFFQLKNALNIPKQDTDDKNKAISNYFVVRSWDDRLTENHLIGVFSQYAWDETRIYVVYAEIKTLNEFKSWLAENNVTIIYELLTPKKEECGEVTAFELVYGENNIGNSENANMIISYVDNKILVDNVGNYKAKPVMEIKGSGTVVVAVNGNTLFRYTFPDGEDMVIIDSQKQDAYLGTLLKNRNMMGEFPVFEVGRNTITWEGAISSIKISSKSRWL